MRGEDDFEAAFDRLLGLSYRHARRLVGDAGLAEELASEALTRTYVRWSKVRTYEFLDAWVLRVVTNLAIDSLAKRHAALRPIETMPRAARVISRSRSSTRTRRREPTP